MPDVDLRSLPRQLYTIVVVQLDGYSLGIDALYALKIAEQKNAHKFQSTWAIQSKIRGSVRRTVFN